MDLGKSVVELKDVNDCLAENGLGVARLAFLSTAPDRIRFLIFQPKGDIVPTDNSLSVAGTALLGEQMAKFLTLAKDKNADFATCPEYSCTWDALMSSVEAGVFPKIGALWSICCESISPAQFDEVERRLTGCGVVTIRPELIDGSGCFLNLLCHLFHAKDLDGRDVRVLLTQAKTASMGGTDYERDRLICGRQIFRFGIPGENRLVCLICSDVLGNDFRNAIVHELQNNTLVVHLQLNRDSASAGFRDYRNQCCYTMPRTTEILCLNWASGTRLRKENEFHLWVEEPKTIYYRPLDGVDGKDAEIIENHKKGCFLVCWDEFKTAAFIFHPDAQIFQVKISKPLMVGAAPAAKRTAPRVEARYEWVRSGWSESGQDADDSFDKYLAGNPQVAAHLAPYGDRHVDLERLMQFATGFVLDEASFHWSKLPSFKLARDDTSSRLRLCWSLKGVGAEHRTECQRRFRSLVNVVDDTAKLPNRLAVFRGSAVRLTYASTPRFQQFRNLVSGSARGTVVFLGLDPEKETLNGVRDQLEKRLYDYNEDRQILSVLYRDASGLLVDHMDSTPPAVNDDPANDPVDISAV